MNGDVNTIKAIQGLLGVTQDGVFGPKSRAALEALIESSRPVVPVVVPTDVHKVVASSFADPKDVRAFRRCKDNGGSDQDCFKVGDNGIGCWGDDVTEGSGPSCALPPEDMEEKFGSVASAKHAKVKVFLNGKDFICVLKDRMPRRANIKNGAGIDLNPDAVRQSGLEPPIMAGATWQWT